MEKASFDELQQMYPPIIELRPERFGPEGQVAIGTLIGCEDDGNLVIWSKQQMPTYVGCSEESCLQRAALIDFGRFLGDKVRGWSQSKMFSTLLTKQGEADLGPLMVCNIIRDCIRRRYGSVLNQSDETTSILLPVPGQLREYCEVVGYRFECGNREKHLEHRAYFTLSPDADLECLPAYSDLRDYAQEVRVRGLVGRSFNRSGRDNEGFCVTPLSSSQARMVQLRVAAERTYPRTLKMLQAIQKAEETDEGIVQTIRDQGVIRFWGMNEVEDREPNMEEFWAMCRYLGMCFTSNERSVIMT